MLLNWIKMSKWFIKYKMLYTSRKISLPFLSVKFIQLTILNSSRKQKKNTFNIVIMQSLIKFYIVSYR